MVDLSDFEKEWDCFYKDEHYSVRDNGAVFRHSRQGKSVLKHDNHWTFGTRNNKGYLLIASEVVNRIVAYAFLGKPPTPQHVVDHIDTNRQNNSPKNLRWVTKLENILLNPITVRRIELVCGSVEAFLANPSKFRDKFPESNYAWMCTVSIQEVQASKERLLSWAKSDNRFQGGTLGEWIFNRSSPKEQVDEAHELTNSLTPNAKQRNWETPTEFPFCPKENGSNPIVTYLKNLKAEKIFSKNQYSNSIIEDFAISKDENLLWILCRNSDSKAIKPYTVAEITYKNDVFVHSSLGSFFKKDGAEKQFTLARGLEWTGGETFDELC